MSFQHVIKFAVDIFKKNFKMIFFHPQSPFRAMLNLLVIGRVGFPDIH